MSQCPKCNRRLRADAIKCLCGWSAAQLAERMPGYPCAHDGCGHNAVCSVKTPTGRANLCRAHYATHFTVDAIKAIATGKPSTQHMEEVRKAYLKSWGFRHGDDHISEAMPERKAA